MSNKDIKKNTVQEKTAEKGAGNFGRGCAKISHPQTQSPQLPDGWIETTLGEVVEICSGKSRPKNKGSFPVYGGNGILGLFILKMKNFGYLIMRLG